MTTELATVDNGGGTLAVAGDYWNADQLAALAHMGVSKDVTEADLRVFHHVCAKTQLDPFMRQIHMVGRNAKDGDRWVTKYTIQTGIDGFRVIGRRAAARDGHSIEISAPEWAHEDGGWRPVWRHEWGFPVAARVTITRDGHAHTGVALWDEYVQTKSGGGITSMWNQRRAGQLAKCAEALAWRMACPYDLAGMYTDDEMGQASNPPPAPARSGLAAALAADTPTDPAPTYDAEVVEAELLPDDETGELLNPRSSLGRQMFALFNEAGLMEKHDRLKHCSDVAERPIESSSDLTVAEARAVVVSLLADKEARS